MKSFKQYISEENNPEHEEMPIYRLSGKPHLPYVEVQDSLGAIHRAPFHSELKNGKIRYDFTEAGRSANAKNGFLRVGARKVGVAELQNHHGREFRHDIFTEGGGRGLGYKGIMLMTYTPEKKRRRSTISTRTRTKTQERKKTRTSNSRWKKIYTQKAKSLTK